MCSDDKVDIAMLARSRCLRTWGLTRLIADLLSLHQSMHTTRADSAYLIPVPRSLLQLYNQHLRLYSNLPALKGVAASHPGVAASQPGCHAAVGRLFSCQTRSSTCGRCQEASVGRGHRQRCRRCHPSSHLHAGRHNSLPGQCGQECGGGVQGGA